RRKQPTSTSWRMDETCIMVKGRWVCLYRAVHKFGKTLDFLLSQRRSKLDAVKFPARAMDTNGPPRKIVIDKSAANTKGVRKINRMLKRFGCPVPIEMVWIRYLNNMVEQDHRFIKRRVRPMLGFKSFTSAASTMAGIKLVNMIRKEQFWPQLRPFQQSCQIA
ncbi:MAG: IS6 family transposase, partial [Alphaproteobacteria bacterium]|nr:IS6 family transposase [Alphaproteobacteria bacterium]